MSVAGMNIIFAGSGEFGLPTLRALLAAGHRIVQVYTQPDRPAGRGKKLSPTPVAQLALEMGLPLVRTADINAEHPPHADAMVVIAFGQKIAPHRVDHPRLGSVNLHASLLPKYRGAAPINWAIIRGETVTGNSVIRLVRTMDAGAILGQSQLPIDPLETAGELHDRLAEDGAALTLQVLDKLVDGTAIETPQDQANATAAPKLSRESAKIDWSRHAPEVASLIRGLYPWPGCRVRIVDEGGADRGRLVLVRSCPAAAVGSAPGVIDPTGLVGAGDGTGVELVEVQPEGKRPMPLAAYRNGHPWAAGMRLESL
jgi:methionyl-tRNA formyltransferase